MKIRTQIGLGLLGLVAIVILVSLGVRRETARVAEFRRLSVESQTRVVAATSFRAQVRNRLLVTFDVIFAEGAKGDPELLQKEEAAIDRKFTEYRALAMRPSPPAAEVVSDLEQLQAQIRELDRELDEVVTEHRAGRLVSAKKILHRAKNDTFGQKFIRTITHVIQTEEAEARRRGEELEVGIRRLNTALVVSTVCGILLAGLLAVFVSRTIGLRLERLEEATREISAGNLDVTLPAEGSDEIAYLSRAFNHMTQAMRDARKQLAEQHALRISASKLSALGKMAGGVAHEINTPLAIVRLRAEILQEALGDGPLEESLARESFGAILEATKRASRIVQGLQSFCRDGSQDPFVRKSVTELFADIGFLCEQKFKSRDVCFECVAPERDWVFAMRASEMSQALMNLLGNALDAAAESSEKWVKLDARVRGDRLEIGVTDSGKGIAAEHRDRIMDPFFTTKAVGSGTGLGLSVAMGIADAHGGTLALDAASERTRFVISLPYGEEKTSSSEPKCAA